MKVLCVVPSYWPAFQLGGPIFSVHNLNKALVTKGAQVNVYTTNAGLPKTTATNQEISVDGVSVIYFTFTGLLEALGATGWQFSLPMTAALKRNLGSFDVVYIVAVWNYPVAIAAYFCRKYQKPYIISPRGLLYPYAIGKKTWKKRPYYCLIAKKAVEGAVAVHYTTKDESDRCHSVLGLKNKAVVIPNGIDLSEFKELPEKKEFRQRHPVLKDKKVILFLGRLNRKKGLDILLKAYGALAKNRDDIHLLISGRDQAGYLGKVRGWVREYGITERVTFTGMLTGREKLEAYAASDIFVLASYSENFGLAVVEAMASGLPVIVSNQVGIHKEISLFEAGVVVDASSEALAGAMEKLLDNPELCRKMGESGRRLANERFRLDKIADDMLGMYRDIALPGSGLC